jgi:hypothetical protein
MKKYLTIAAVLGVIAFASVSFLARADQQPAHNVILAKQDASQPAMDPSDGEAAADKADASVAPATPESSDPGAKFTHDDGECADKSETPDKAGNPPTDTQKNTAYRKCMQMKGHSAAELKKNGVDLSNKSEKSDTKDHDAPADE